MRELLIPTGLQDQIAKEAHAAAPRECCGLLVGTEQGETFRVLYLRSTRNVAVEPDRFEIDPAPQIALMRALRGTGRRIIGCYHSHPDGTVEPSPIDLASSFERGFVWLIAGVSGRKAQLRAFLREEAGFRELTLLDRVPARTV